MTPSWIYLSWPTPADAEPSPPCAMSHFTILATDSRTVLRIGGKSMAVALTAGRQAYLISLKLWVNAVRVIDWFFSDLYTNSMVRCCFFFFFLPILLVWVEKKVDFLRAKCYLIVSTKNVGFDLFDLFFLMLINEPCEGYWTDLQGRRMLSAIIFYITSNCKLFG